ncbi:MAG: hypothetical protein ABIG63_08670 [Chloroflexota bacterium]
MSRRTLSFLTLLSALSLGGYLLSSHLFYRLGFPLDDAWIHQTYARNLALGGEWAFIPGQPSAGSTGPLWAALLAVGHFLHLGPAATAHLLGWASLWALGALGVYTFQLLSPQHQRVAPWAGALLVVEWHLVWAAGSGMETLLFALVVTLLLTLLLVGRISKFDLHWLGNINVGRISKFDLRRLGNVNAGRISKFNPHRLGNITVGRISKSDPRWLCNINVGRISKFDPRRLGSVTVGRISKFDLRWLGMGALIGLSVWLRPDGITLLAPAIFVILLSRNTWRDKLRMSAGLAIGFGLIFIPYLYFNWAVAGTWWPNTFYAKQVEYAELRQLPIISRLLQQGMLPLVGVGVVLLPGFIIFVVDALQRRKWPVLAGALWVVGYLALYAWRLPVTYQHGRYVIPMMPIFFLWGFAGFVAWIQADKPAMGRRIVGRAWLVTTALVLLLFWGVGARTYSRDVAVIESEMVSVAHWVAENTPAEALIAAHDTGALGYFGNRALLDLAGLISPDVIPFIRDEALLEEYLDSEGADYLVTFPGWYPRLVGRATLRFQTDGSFSPALGGENMAVYKWPGQ